MVLRARLLYGAGDRTDEGEVREHSSEEPSDTQMMRATLEVLSSSSFLNNGSTPSAPMKGIACSSGGKDSILALHLAVSSGVEVDTIMTMIPEDQESMLYHTHNVNLVGSLAKVMGFSWIPVRAPRGEELDSLKRVFPTLKMDCLITGGIASNYQKKRFDEACDGAGIEHYAPLWGMKPEEVYGKILGLGMDVIIVSVAAYGLGEEWLGRHLDGGTVRKLMTMSAKYGFNAVGEGGDLDTFVLDAPLYRLKMRPTKVIRKWEGDRGRLEILELAEEGK